MRQRVAVVYNEPIPSRYDRANEEKAVLGVLDAVKAVEEALRQLGHEVSLLPLVPPFNVARQKLAALDVGVVFNLFEGFCGEPETEVLVPETLTELGIKYTGCRPSVLRLALDKAAVKKVLKKSIVPTPDFQVLAINNLHDFKLDFPCIVKPRAEDASHGISADSLVRDFRSLERQVRFISDSFHSGALVEHYLGGREFNATVMGNSQCSVLPISEIVYSLPPEVPRILTFAAKWEPGSPYFEGTKVVCPAEVTVSELEHISKTATSAFRLVVGQGYARMDMRMDEVGKLNIIEVNPNPDISPGTGAARQSKAAGMSYAEFIGEIIELALE
ncbi:MAG: ATP-grasp domain-containing protein [Dehalococcoidales bacterium]|nr:ATP-grasp domain-containing protein [Dehalococcoidales bacterium]